MPSGDKIQAEGPSAKDHQVRVFISSTFRDMHAERDHLVTVVFPELRERVEQLGQEFFNVELRRASRNGYCFNANIKKHDPVKLHAPLPSLSLLLAQG